MTVNTGSACYYCGAVGGSRQICTEKYAWGGIPFSCARCGGAIFRRTISSATSDEYWEGDAVNEKVYTIPEVRRAFAQKYERYLTLFNNGNGAGSRLLEIGCGSGIFLEAALRHGWVVHGLDVSAQAVELTRRNCPGATVVCAPLEKAGFDPSTFDLIALWDVIEHVEDPEELLGQARLFLRTGGTLVMETPDEGCLARMLVRFAHRVTGGRVSLLRSLYYPAHRWYFSRRAVATVLRRVGFDGIRFYREQTVREFGSRKHAAYGSRNAWPQRVSNLIAGSIGMVPWLRNKMVVMAVKS